MLRKTENSFEIKRKILFFCKDDDGQDLFYPWCYPGESFYVNQQQAFLAKIFLYSLISVFLVALATVVFLGTKEIIDVFAMSYCLAAMSMSVSIVYFLGIYLFSKNKKFFSVPTAMRPEKSASVLWQILFFQILAVVLSVFDGFVFDGLPLIDALLIIVSCSLYAGFIFFIILKNREKNGYFIAE